ncbi:hypothetical protein WME79_05960 [Sorangium sp. So ce726]|uniref:hypothetical protein n=1 Tax=Sorangium sp. So ce726 TaxID=3133319 RepID=UPI003F5F2A33
MMKRALLLVVALIASACDGGGGSTSGAGDAGGGAATGGGAGGGGSAATSGGGDAGDGGGGAAGGSGAGGAPAGPGVTGVLADEAGQPIGGATVLFCNTAVCYSDRSRADGRFTFLCDAEPPVDFVLKSMEDAGTTPRRGTTMFPLRFTDAVTVDAGLLFVPHLPAGAVLGPNSDDPQVLEVGDGLQLTVNRAALATPLGEALHDIAARRIPPERVPPLPDLGGEEIVAVYALYPFATTSDAPVGVQAPSDLEPGTPVRFRTMSEYDGKLSAPAAGEADGAVVKTAPLSGIDELTWIVISR